jgi:hypothetical protein
MCCWFRTSAIPDNLGDFFFLANSVIPSSTVLSDCYHQEGKRKKGCNSCWPMITESHISHLLVEHEQA